MRIAISAILVLSGIWMVPAVVAEEVPTPSPMPAAPTAPGGAAAGRPGAARTGVPARPAAGPTAPAPGGVTPAARPRPSASSAAPVSGDELIPFTFENMQLASIIKIVAERTGRNFLIQTPITGTVLIYCPKMIPARTAFDILGIILDSQGYTMAVSEDPPLVFVTKKTGAPALPTEVLVEGEGRSLEKKHELATLIVVLKYVSVDDMESILRNFRSPNCVMTVYPAGNFLILKDEEAKLKYLLSLIKKVDVPGTVSKVTMVELKYADATETAALLTELLAERAGGRVSRPVTQPPTPSTRGRPTVRPTTRGVATIVGTAAPLKILADTRTNRLIILAPEKDTEYIVGLVKKMDVEPTEEMYPIRTYIAQYQNAEDLADTLASFVSGQQRSRTERQRRTTQRPGAQGRTARQQPTARPTAPTAAARRQATAGGTEEVFFLADPATNMVLVQAPPQKIDMYMNLLKELDQPQKQVVIQVWVVEVSSKSQLDIGMEFQSAEIGPAEGIGPMQDQIFGGTNFDLGLGNLLSGTGFPSSGISLGLRSLTNTRLNVGGKVYYVPNFDSFLRALREDTEINILSSPNLMTLNNEPASVDVTDEISISQSRIASYASLEQQAAVPGAYTETFQRQEVGITLEITPQINSENSVIMDIYVQVGDLAGVEDITQASSRPVISRRSTETRVRVDNDKTIVISGLRRTNTTKTTSRIPILGQIPILGILFSHERSLVRKTNLLIFITPHIVSDTLDMLEVTELLKNQNLEKERKQFQPARKARKRRTRTIEFEPSWEWKK